MQDIGLGAGIAVMAFWLFVGIAVLATTWNTIRKRETQHQTLRRIIESGQQVDMAVLDKLLQVSENSSTRLDRDFKTGAYAMIPVSFGLVAMALVMGIAIPDVTMPLLGTAALLLVLGVGFYISGRLMERWYDSGEATGLGSDKD